MREVRYFIVYTILSNIKNSRHRLRTAESQEMKFSKQKEQELLHEVLDRAHIASKHLQMALGDHDMTLKHKDIQIAYEKAVEKIEDLYQLIGRKLE